MTDGRRACTMSCRRSAPLLATLLLLVSFASSSDAALDADVLIQFKATISDSTGALKGWDASSSPCKMNVSDWAGVICDDGGNVSGLRLEGMGLAGSLAGIGVLDALPGLRTLSLIRNSFEGAMPEVRKLKSLRGLYFSGNKFSGEIPGNAFDDMGWLKKLYLSENDFSGPVPVSIAKLPKLLELRLDDNRFTGQIPEFQILNLKLVNLSNNYLEGPIPAGLRNMDAAFFAGNKALCGEPLQDPCQPSSSSSTSPHPNEQPNQHPFVILAVAIFIFAGIIAVVFLMPRQRSVGNEQLPQPLSSKSTKAVACAEAKVETGTAGFDGSTSGRKSSVGAKENEQGRLVFVRKVRQRFELQDLLKSSAEVLGTGVFGCSYRASIPGGPSMVVKRYRDMNRMGKEDFEEHMRRLGRLAHPNLLPLVGYYYRKDEKLLVAEYVPKRSLANALHGSRAANAQSLDWPARLKVIRGIAKGLNYLYEELQMLSVPHGHLKSSNVLLSDCLEPLLADYALVPLLNQAPAAQYMAAFKSPEFKHNGRTSKKSDIWSLGVLILEILTGKIPATDSRQGKEGIDLAQWVSSVPKQEWAVKVFDREMRAKKNSEGEIIKLLQIGLACCQVNVDKRCELEEALDKIEELKDEAEGDNVA